MKNARVRQRHSRARLVSAFGVAAAADAISVVLSLAPPIQWAIDLVTALLLFAILGRQWMLLPGLVLEAIPGIAVVPFWTIVVGTIATLGVVRSDLTDTTKSRSTEYGS